VRWHSEKLSAQFGAKKEPITMNSLKVENIIFREYLLEIKEPLPGWWQVHIYPTRAGLPFAPGLPSFSSADREQAIRLTMEQVECLLNA
jgi:hypothetical protein